jgi:hypothetical protein
VGLLILAFKLAKTVLQLRAGVKPQSLATIQGHPGCLQSVKRASSLLTVTGDVDEDVNVKKLVQETLSSEGANGLLMILDKANDHEVLLSKTNSGSKMTRLSDHLPRDTFHDSCHWKY